MCTLILLTDHSNDNGMGLSNQFIGLEIVQLKEIVPAYKSKAPPIMPRRTKKFVEDLKLINENFPVVECKIGGESIKLFTPDNYVFMGVVKLLGDNFSTKPKQDRPMKVVVRGITSDVRPYEIKK